jgi:hypothetical protein
MRGEDLDVVGILHDAQDVAEGVDHGRSHEAASTSSDQKFTVAMPRRKCRFVMFESSVLWFLVIWNDLD